MSIAKQDHLIAAGKSQRNDLQRLSSQPRNCQNKPSESSHSTKSLPHPSNTAKYQPLSLQLRSDDAFAVCQCSNQNSLGTRYNNSRSYEGGLSRNHQQNGGQDSRHQQDQVEEVFPEQSYKENQRFEQSDRFCIIGRRGPIA